MEYKYLPKSNLKVSALALGTMTFGEQNSQNEAHEQLDFALAQGINFIDTAEMYPVPPKADTCGKTEQFIGSWPKLKSNRDKIILATKVIGRDLGMPHIRNGRARLDKKNIREALTASLRKLNTDYIDLYQVHWPDRETNYFGRLGYTHLPEEDGVSLLETHEVLNDLVKEGLIRHLGVSNETPWGLMTYLKNSEKYNLSPIVSIQNPYNLLNRTFEIGLAEISHRENVGLLAYSPLAFGTLTGKYLGGKKPAKSRLTLYSRFTRYQKPEAILAQERYVALARRFNISPAHLALQFVTTRPFVLSNIIGATTLAQLQENISSLDTKLSSEILIEIEKIHQKIPNPSP